MEVSPLAREACYLYPLHYRAAFACSILHTPTPLSSPYGSLSLAGDVWAYHVPHEYHWMR